MFEKLKVRRSQGRQYIPILREAVPTGFRGKPVISAQPCASACQACVEVCPSAAITLAPPRIDLGRCILCGDCGTACPSGKIDFSPDPRMASTTREGLLIDAEHPDVDPVQVSEALRRVFGRSMKMRSVSAGGCNGCEMELNALGNVNFDLGRYGIEMVASPRHADALVLSGPITRNMAQALRICWDTMPEPKLVIATGACAISGGVFAECDTLDRQFLEQFKPSLYVPGCPVHPLSVIVGILDLLGIG